MVRVLPSGDGKQPWPPEEYSGILDMYQEAALWYGGSIYELSSYYANRTQIGPGVNFWQRSWRHQRSIVLHVPVAADIAQLSAQLLFGEEPEFTIPDATEESAPAEATRCQERLEDLIDLCAISSKLLEGAEICAGLGGVFYKIDVDIDLAEHPIVSVVQPDMALPVFKWGVLESVIFWREIDRTEKVVVRHLELHTREGVQHGVYVGTPDYLGVMGNLQDYEATWNLPEFYPTDDLNVVYIPNMLPNRRYRGEPYGQPDYADCYPLMEAIDEAYTSWMRDLRLGASRVIVPEEYLDVDTTSAATFDVEREVFCPLNFDPTNEGTKITNMQFPIRFAEHEATVVELLTRTVSACGYAVQTFSIGQEKIQSSEAAAAIRVKERKSLATKAKKERYWGRSIEYLLYRLLVVDAQTFSTGVVPMPVTMAFGDSYAPDLHELAVSVELLERARAASAETKVMIIHPDWDREQVDAEVARLEQVATTIPGMTPTPQGSVNQLVEGARENARAQRNKESVNNGTTEPA